jgi:hypothetical protein
MTALFQVQVNFTVVCESSWSLKRILNSKQSGTCAVPTKSCILKDEYIYGVANLAQLHSNEENEI